MGKQTIPRDFVFTKESGQAKCVHQRLWANRMFTRGCWETDCLPEAVGKQTVCQRLWVNRLCFPGPEQTCNAGIKIISLQWTCNVGYFTVFTETTHGTASWCLAWISGRPGGVVGKKERTTRMEKE